MKQVSYKEATLSFIEIRNGNDDIELVETVLDYFRQHKPPTWEDVVAYWKDYVSTSLVVYIEDNILYVKDTNEEGTQHFMYEIESGYYEFMATELCEVIAINLTIRYLESQKEKE